MKKLIATLTIIVVALLGTGIAANAAKPSSTPATISLNQTDPHLGDYVNFTVSYNEKKNASVAVSITCSQNGTPVFVDLAFTGPGQSPYIFLGGLSSPWVTNGGSADCEAHLASYIWHGGQETVVDLTDPITFTAAG
jgi:hypothetical protein